MQLLQVPHRVLHGPLGSTSLGVTPQPQGPPHIPRGSLAPQGSPHAPWAHPTAPGSCPLPQGHTPSPQGSLMSPGVPHRNMSPGLLPHPQRLPHVPSAQAMPQGHPNIPKAHFMSPRAHSTPPESPHIFRAHPMPLEGCSYAPRGYPTTQRLSYISGRYFPWVTPHPQGSPRVPKGLLPYPQGLTPCPWRVSGGHRSHCGDSVIPAAGCLCWDPLHRWWRAAGQWQWELPWAGGGAAPWHLGHRLRR